MSVFSKNLKYLRNTKRLSQGTIAKIVGKDRSLVSQWESDDKNATVEDIIKLSDYFNIPMDILVGTNMALSSKRNDELDVLFDKHKDILTESDKQIIKTIIEERKKEIDKEQGNNQES